MRAPHSPLRRLPRQRRLVTGAVAATVLLAACGGGSSDGDSSSGADSEALPQVESGDSAESADGVSADPAPPVALQGTQVDLVGPDVVAEAEIETNLLPSVVLDDVSTGRKVNFRNLVPQEKPILLWMYAPH